MAGPGKSGPPAKGGEEAVEYQLFKAQVLDLRRQNMTHAEIGAIVGMDRSGIGKLLKRIFRELLDENGAEEVRAAELLRHEQMIQRLLPAILVEGNDENGNPKMPSLKAIDSYLKLSINKANLVGAFAPKAVDLTVKQSDDDDEVAAADRIANNVNRFMDLADKILQGGYGSGRKTDDDVLDAEVVDDDLADAETDMAPPVGEFVNGKFVPLAIAAAPEPDDPEVEPEVFDG